MHTNTAFNLVSDPYEISKKSILFDSSGLSHQDFKSAFLHHGCFWRVANSSYTLPSTWSLTLLIDITLKLKKKGSEHLPEIDQDWFIVFILQITSKLLLSTPMCRHPQTQEFLPSLSTTKNTLNHHSTLDLRQSLEPVFTVQLEFFHLTSLLDT